MIPAGLSPVPPIRLILWHKKAQGTFLEEEPRNHCTEPQNKIHATALSHKVLKHCVT